MNENTKSSKQIVEAFVESEDYFIIPRNTK